MKYDPSTAFRLPEALLATVDSFCHQMDLTRSQLFRRSLTEYLKNRNIEITAEPQGQKLQWSRDLYDRQL